MKTKKSVIVLMFLFTLITCTINAQDKTGILILAHGGLENRGVNKIVVVQLFISSYSPIMRQNEYLLGLRDELADEPMLMDHSSTGHENHSSMSHNNDETELKPLNHKSKIYLAEPLNDHSLIADILFERISELSNTPENETVILVAHGPNDEEDNRMWVKTLDSLADQIRDKNK